MTELILGVGEPFASPAWGSNFVVFTGETGEPVSEENAKAYLSKACRYARSYGVYLVPERLVLMGYQCLCLLSPAGMVLGAQKSAYASPSRRGGKRSTTLEVLSTEFGGIFLCVDADVYHPEVARYAAGLGAQIYVCSQQLSRLEYGSHLVVSGVWSVAQQNRAFSIGVSGQYHCVCAPLQLTTHADGFVAPPNLRLPMTARIDASQLASVPPRPALSRRFYATHRDELIRPLQHPGGA